MKFKVATKNADETMQFAEKFATLLTSPCVIALDGDLSAGKTTFAKGFAKGLGIEKMITSPTFTILNEYDFQNKNDIKKLYHFDMYRLENEDDAFALGLEEYFDLKKLNGFVLVEWADRIKNILPEKYIIVNFSKISDNERSILISGN
ncbi:MAG: tRNA (adenosine(37)-N6)-threonylcarbamoyltransferase complex ATPase subunit type 1 TsaE [Clostridia bacterium]|jgi:tRNA threonylcarbamoyladenosine biosynthesis protein TsaE|nr:tRNA (adenosine(37)-N6)-threonylcarbamoyltransferase complex ATPase subunit type 1 TsaE [Clostridia bacterium]MDD4408607.1 tRNA (adenosine(37)-N6)-threonylcarbamoyltransferase complex ATPase subunit type 1 TsaE [Clostridia bacterium]